MMGDMDLAEFLLARIAEDEAEARRLVERYGCEDDTYWAANADDVVITLGLGRALAECEAKRRIVERAMPNESDDPRTERGRILRVLASVYADHPDYREEWRP